MESPLPVAQASPRLSSSSAIMKALPADDRHAASKLQFLIQPSKLRKLAQTNSDSVDQIYRSIQEQEPSQGKDRSLKLLSMFAQTATVPATELEQAKVQNAENRRY